MAFTRRISTKSVRFATVAVSAVALTVIATAAPTMHDPVSDTSASRTIHGLSAFDSCTLELFEEGASSPDDPQKRLRYPASLGWTTSAVWQGEQLLLADTTRERVVAAELTGRVDAVDFPATAEKRRQSPSFLSQRPAGGFAVGYFLREPEHVSVYERVYFADAGAKTAADARFEDYFLEPRGRIYFDPARQQKMVSRGFFQGVTTNNGLFMVGGASPWDSRSRYVPLVAYVDHKQFVAYKNPLPDDEFRKLTTKTFARDFPLMTVVEENGESVAYILFLEETPWIGRARTHSTEIERLPHFPKNWSRVPSTEISEPTATAVNEYVAEIEQYYRHIEKSEMPVGLYSWKNRLFILAKGKANPTNGHTAWQLVEVSKESGRTIRQIPLPSESEHILLVPATDQGLFAILEQGSIDIIDNLRLHYLYRPANKTVFFPQTRLDVRDTPGLLEAKSSSCTGLWARAGAAG